MFFEKYKKIIFIVGFIFIVFALGYAIYSLFFKASDNTITPYVNNISNSTSTTGLPSSQTGDNKIITSTNKNGLPGEEDIPEQTDPDKIGKNKIIPGSTEEITKNKSIGAVISANGSDVQYYDKNEGKFYRVDKDGNIVPLADKIFHDVENITWSKNKEKAILEYPDGSNIVYNFTTSKQITLPTHWKDFDFSPNGDKLVMKSIGVDPDNRWLAVTNEDGSSARRIEALGDKDTTVYPSWSPNNQTIAMYTEGIDFDRQEVFFVGLNHENFKSMIIDGRGFQPKWSPTGDRLLYSIYSSNNDLKPSLWIANAQGDSIGSGRKNLNIDTWAEKCIFKDNSNVYCAVPENLEEGAGLFPELAQTTTDKLYEIDTRTGLKKIIASPEDGHNMTDLIISDNGYYLFFTDANTKKIFKIKLK